jgi:sugar O-acyltransferase (sialic acid O-acetyltransferase NeuD family)
MKTLGIIGGGHLGQQLAYHALSLQFDKVVFFDDTQARGMVHKYGTTLGAVADINTAYKNQEFDALIVGIGYKHMAFRKAIFEQYQGIIPFANIIHKTAWVDPSATLGEGIVIYAAAIIDADAVIKDNVLMNVGATVAHDSTIGAHSFLAPRVAVAGFAEIGASCILGINSTVIDNIKIAPQTQLGGGTLVIKNIEQKGLYVGNPAKFIR